MQIKKKRKSIAVGLVLLACGVVAAKEYFLVSFNMPMENDRETEWASAQSFFSQAQPVLNKNRAWNVGDTFIVQYTGGVIAKFKLSERGKGGCLSPGNPLLGTPPSKCTWLTSVPFDEPEIIQTKTQNLGKQSVVLPFSNGQGIPYSIYLPNQMLYITSFYQWTITAGGSPGGGGSGGAPIRRIE